MDATTKNREMGNTAEKTVTNAQHSAQVMMDYVAKAREINAEITNRAMEVWVEGFRRQTDLSQKVTQEFFDNLDKIEEQGYATEASFARGFPTWWAPYSYDPFAFWRMWAKTLQESARDTQRTLQKRAEGTQRTAAEETARVIESTAPGSGSLPIPGYDHKKVGEITSRLDALTDEQLRRVKDYERRNKHRETLLQEIDRRIRPVS